MAHLARRTIISCAIAGLVPLAAAVGLAWMLATLSSLTAGEIAICSAATGLGLLLFVMIVVMIVAGREEDPSPASEPVLPGEEPHQEPVIWDLGDLVDSLVAEQKGPPGPTLRKLIYYARPSAHRPQRVRVNAAVEVCVRAMQASGAENGHLSFDPDPNVGAIRLDPDTFHQLLLNLVRNAREAAGPTGHVDIRTQAMDGTVLIAVRDDGPGVPTEEIDRMFEPFVSTRKGAAGLGLAICRQIAAAHDGTILATNVVPRGLEVGVKLPALPY